MAEDPKSPRPKMLNEVVITAKRYKKANPKAKLYPSGEIEKSKIDSLVKAGRGDLIGEPIRKEGHVDMYGAAASDAIKQLTKRK